MSSKAEKERLKALQEKFQAILSNLLKDDDNKYCVDCDAKGPRWASWNLGIFLCIRCAGIHRNLGVHISRVKSVNLDTWTPEQVVMMQEVGNSRARAAYEANIPDNFRRPQTDSALEAFIRAKYESKKYIAREWVTPKPVVPKEWLEDDRDKKRSKPKPSSTIQLNSAPKAKPSPSSSSQEKKSSPDKPKAPATSSPAAPRPQQSSGAADLIGLDASSPTNQANGGGDLLADIFGNSEPTQAAQTAQTPTGGAGATTPQGGQEQNGSIEANLFDDGSSEKGSEKSTKESILALYGSGGGQQQQQQMFGVPGGMYMPQGNMGMYGGGMQGQMPPQQGMVGAPGMQYQQGMMGMQQQPNMYGMGQMGMQGGMMGAQPQMGGGMMMGGQQQMYPQQQQQQQQQQMQFQQMQQQMGSMKLGGGTQMGGMPQGGVGGWGGQNSGQTLSTNLWQ